MVFSPYSSLCVFVFCLSLGFPVFFVSAISVCPRQSDVFLNSLQSHCPIEIFPNPLIQVDGEFLDRALTSKQRKSYASVLFYASWCPFSRNVHPTFEILSSMFPQVEHFAVEQSSALPSLFSRYGIHSLPSILLVNQTSRVRYSGPKDLHSLVQFYERTTGFKPAEYFVEEQPINMGSTDKLIMQPWIGSSLKEVIEQDRYLVFAILFISLKLLVSISPEVLSHLKSFWVSHVPHINLEIFGGTSQLFRRALHMVDVRRVWTKLRFCKTRNFQAGAKNARVWASSLASVSLGESSSSRSSS